MRENLLTSEYKLGPVEINENLEKLRTARIAAMLSPEENENSIRQEVKRNTI
jgi:hypothetical protein